MKRLLGSKGKYILIALVLIICLIFFVMYLRWNSYYDKMWKPLVDEYHSKGGNGRSTTYNGVNFFMCVPNMFEYETNIGTNKSRPYDSETEEPQYFANIYVWPMKDGTYEWQVCIDQITAMNAYENVCQADIDPDTLEVLSDWTPESEREFLKTHKDMVYETISEVREFWSVALG